MGSDQAITEPKSPKIKKNHFDLTSNILTPLTDTLFDLNTKK